MAVHAGLRCPFGAAHGHFESGEVPEVGRHHSGRFKETLDGVRLVAPHLADLFDRAVARRRGQHHGARIRVFLPDHVHQVPYVFDAFARRDGLIQKTEAVAARARRGKAHLRALFGEGCHGGEGVLSAKAHALGLAHETFLRAARWEMELSTDKECLGDRLARFTAHLEAGYVALRREHGLTSPLDIEPWMHRCWPRSRRRDRSGDRRCATACPVPSARTSAPIHRFACVER